MQNKGLSKQQYLTEWIANNFDVWEKICGLQKITYEEYRNIIHMLNKENFVELEAVVSTIFYEQHKK